jgi:hypothetical protein
VNPDLIASGLSPLRPELAALAAGRLFLRQLDRLAKSKNDFSFESTLSGLTYISRLRRLKSAPLGPPIIMQRGDLLMVGCDSNDAALAKQIARFRFSRLRITREAMVAVLFGSCAVLEPHT